MIVDIEKNKRNMIYTLATEYSDGVIAKSLREKLERFLLPRRNQYPEAFQKAFPLRSNIA